MLSAYLLEFVLFSPFVHPSVDDNLYSSLFLFPKLFGVTARILRKQPCYFITDMSSSSDYSKSKYNHDSSQEDPSEYDNIESSYGGSSSSLKHSHNNNDYSSNYAPRNSSLTLESESSEYTDTIRVKTYSTPMTNGARTKPRMMVRPGIKFTFERPSEHPTEESSTPRESMSKDGTEVSKEGYAKRTHTKWMTRQDVDHQAFQQQQQL
ncbi:hypothetical protein L1987_14942 [Smallanthus sonchifolius]|uniref:Uncharacterized protein n=1 Tax=Smallanthus sonchifolius TaxID=185202 RepID=A0ACB9J4R1_9ASTR|nr:hypothetical protein L1987_14942 [Smallanthus sonchifolius]